MKRITSFIRLLVCLIFMAATTQHALAAIDITATQPANGTGTTADPYQIGTPGELYWFAKQVNNGQNTISAKLTADIVVNENVLKAGTFDLNGVPANVWTPIGTSGISGKYFKGTFDGNGHTISGLYFNNTTNKSYPDGGNDIGFIGFAFGATIKNVVVKDSYLYGYQCVSGFCGSAGGSTKITNCGYEGYVYGSIDAYGIAYNYSATVENCYSVSNQPLAYKATTNCYHDNIKCTYSTTYSSGKPSEAFASGEVAFLLGDAWGQKIGTDATPRLGGDKVYKNTYSGECSGEGYSNVDEHGVVTERNHNCNEEGVCIHCGFYIISTADQLYAFAAKVNAGQTTLSAKLTADIVVNENVLKAGTLTLNGTPSRRWTPIGTSGNNFQGTFDGNGHTISGLYFNNTSSSNYPEGGQNIGLIGYAYGATIKNVVVKDSYIYGYQYVAGICGYANGSTQITNCGYEGYVYGSSYAYGIAYNYSATVENCYGVSNQRLAYKATTNCYHDNNKITVSTANSTGKSSEAFASGEVAFLLGDAWGQKIGTDATPKLGGAVIYSITTTIATGGHGTFICPSYANEGETITCSSEPNIGYELVLKVNGNAHTGNTFTMPAENTTLLVDFTKIDYAVTTATGLTGGSISASATAQYQDQVTVASTPAVGYKLDEITVTDASGNAVAVADGKFTMPASAVSVSASFSKIDYAVTTATGLTGGSVSAAATAQYQDEVTVTVTPAVGYKLDAITVKDASNNAVAVSNGKFTMPASAVNVSASFSKIDYAVTTATGLTGGSVSADATAQYQDEVTVTVTPATGYKLDAISVKDASNNAVAVTNGKFSMPASAVSVSASFSKIDYIVTTATGLTGGSIAANTTAQYQDEVTVTSTPETGYKLDAITVTDASGNTIAVADGKFTMPASAVNVNAVFSKIDYAVTTATGLTGGSVSADATAQYQDEVTVTATPAVGYKLDAITVKDASGNAVAVTNGKFTMPASAVNVTASFSKIDYAVTTATGLTGGSVSADATAQYQDEVTVTATPAVGYKLDEITVTDASGNAVAVSNGKFTMPASAVKVSASFSPTGYVENGQVYGDWVVTSDYTIAAGETLVIPAGTTVTTYGGAVIINNGTLKVENEISGVTLAGDGVFNYTTLDKYDVTFGTATYNGSAITIGNGLDVTYATKTFCGKTFTFDAESCTITYTNNVNASVGTRYAVVTWAFSGNTATKEFAILKRKLNLTGFIANNKNYDSTTQATGSFSDDRIAGDELEFNYKCAFEDENVGTGKNVSFYRIEIDGGADADNYELVTTEGSASANINKAPLTIKANDFTINVGDEMPIFTVEYDGFVAAQNVEVLSTLPTVGVDITETSVDGTYDINVSGAEADNYEISYTKGTLTIKPENATSIDNVSSADVKIFARGNVIVVENAVSPIEVFDIAGSRIERQSEILSRVEIPMSARGVFVVRTGNISQKVIVK